MISLLHNDRGYKAERPPVKGAVRAIGFRTPGSLTGANDASVRDQSFLIKLFSPADNVERSPLTSAGILYVGSPTVSGPPQRQSCPKAQTEPGSGSAMGWDLSGIGGSSVRALLSNHEELLSMRPPQSTASPDALPGGNPQFRNLIQIHDLRSWARATMAKMTNSRAREIVNKWLADAGRKVPWEGHNYVDFVTEVRLFSGVDYPDGPFDVWIDRAEACDWLRELARYIEEGVNPLPSLFDVAH